MLFLILQILYAYIWVYAWGTCYNCISDENIASTYEKYISFIARRDLIVFAEKLVFFS